MADTPHETLMEEQGFPALVDQQGESVTQAPGGSGSTAVADCLWFEQEPAREVTPDEGRRVIRQGILYVPDSATLTIFDTWTIRSEVWQTVDLKPKPAGGYHRVSVRREEQEATEGPLGDLL